MLHFIDDLSSPSLEPSQTMVHDTVLSDRELAAYTADLNHSEPDTLVTDENLAFRSYN